METHHGLPNMNSMRPFTTIEQKKILEYNQHSRVYDRLNPILRRTKKINAAQATRLIVPTTPSVRFSSNGNKSVATC
jgi:hypothetical protein